MSKYSFKYEDIFYTLGQSILSACIVYIIIFCIELEKELDNFIIHIMYEYTMISDYLTDFIYDCMHIKNKEFQLNRLIKLYEEIHNFKIYATTSEKIVFVGKRKKALEMYLNSLREYASLLDYLVEKRNEAILMLHNSTNSIYRKNNSHNPDLFIMDVIETARYFNREFLNCNAKLKEIMGYEYEVKTEYRTPLS